MSKKRLSLLVIGVILLIGFLIPQHLVKPVEGMNKSSYHPKSFWYYPWGKSITHKGVDIFAKSGTAVKSATGGIVVFAGSVEVGGNVVLVLGPKWRVHYYAHLNTIDTKRWSFVGSGEHIGRVGDTGNAKGKPPHLHYTIFTLIPYPWHIDSGPQGWRKMFYLNPIEYLEKSE